MVGDTMPHRDADSGDLSILDPDTGVGRPASSVEAEVSERKDGGHLQVAQISVHGLAQFRSQIDDRIDHQLARPMISHVPAAACPVDRHLLWSKNVGFFPAPTDRVDMWMLYEEQEVRGGFTLFKFHKVLLQPKGSQVVHPVE